MKRILFFVLVSFICGNAAAQINLLKKKILVGEIQNENLNLVVDTKSFLDAINKEFSDGFDHVEIKSGETTGERTETFYYIDITSSKNGTRMVRWLTNKNGKLYLERKMSDKSIYKSYFTACTGTENCEPMLYVDKDITAWICGDSPQCVTEEEAKRNPCTRSITIITRY